MNRAYGRGRLTTDDRARIDELAARGLNSTRIAQVLKRHQSTVQWYMYSNGLQAPKQTDTPKVYVRSGRTVRGFSRDEDTFITALRIQDFKPEEIARICSKRFGTERSHHTIRCRLKMLAAIEEAA